MFRSTCTTGHTILSGSYAIWKPIKKKEQTMHEVLLLLLFIWVVRRIAKKKMHAKKKVK